MKILTVPLTILLLASSTLHAQSNGSISGTVTGATSAGIAGATVTATNITSSTWFSAITNASGAFDLSYIPIGSYIVSAQSKGLKKTLPAIQLESNQTVRLNLRLESGTAPVPVETRTAMPAPMPKIDETKLTVQDLVKLTNKVFQQNTEPELSLNLRKLLSDPKSIANS